MKQIEIIKFKPIGIVHSPFTNLEGIPIQPTGGTGIQGEIEIFQEYEKGLEDLDGFSHIILLYYCHLANKPQLKVVPFLDTKPRGVFATRAPARPNAIGFSIVKLMRRKSCSLTIENIDILEGTPLLDIKPYIPEIDHQMVTHVGWLEGKTSKFHKKLSDRRFS